MLHHIPVYVREMGEGEVCKNVAWTVDIAEVSRSGGSRW